MREARKGIAQDERVPMQVKRTLRRGAPSAGPTNRSAWVARLPVWRPQLPGPFGRLYEDDRAVALILFTLMLAALLGLAALVTDVGLAYVNKRAMQNAVDAAAMAGAHYLPDNPTEALTVARNYANLNGVTDSELDSVTSAQYKFQVTTTNSKDDTLVVSAQRAAPYTFRKIVGGGDATIFVTSSVMVTAQVPNGDLVPWAISLSQTTTNSTSQIPTPCTSAYAECTLKDGATFSIGGNFQELDWSEVDGATRCKSGGGESDYKCYIEYGYSGPVPTPVGTSTTTGEPIWNWSVNTYPGDRGRNNTDAITQLFGWDDAQDCHGGAASCSNLYVSPPDGVPNLNPGKSGKVCYNDIRCPRVLVVPMISNDWNSIKGKQPVTIVSFGCFYVTQDTSLTFPPGKAPVYGMFIPNCHGYDTAPMYGVPIDGSGTGGQIIAPVLWQ